MDDFQARPKSKKLKQYTLTGLLNLPAEVVGELLCDELAKNRITIRYASPESRHVVVADQLMNVVGGYEVDYPDPENKDYCKISPIGGGNYFVEGPVREAHERALLIALWREIKESKSRRKRLEQYNLDELLAMPPGQEMDDLLNLCHYGFLGGGTCKRSSDDSIVGHNLKKLRELVGPFTFWVWAEDDRPGEWRIDWPLIDFVAASPTPAHCVATALLIAYWLKLKAEDEVSNG